MIGFFDSIAFLLVAAGIFCYLLSILLLLRPSQGLMMMLDLWMAAGLVRLSVNLSWETLAGSAALIACRKLIIAFLAQSRS